MIIKLIRNFINNYGIGTEDGMFDDNTNPIIAFCITDDMGNAELCGYLFGVSNMGVRAYTGVSVRSTNFDLTKRGNVKIIGIDMV